MPLKNIIVDVSSSVTC